VVVEVVQELMEILHLVVMVILVVQEGELEEKILLLQEVQVILHL
jgi:hypothetical protein